MANWWRRLVEQRRGGLVKAVEAIREIVSVTAALWNKLLLETVGKLRLVRSAACCSW